MKNRDNLHFTWQRALSHNKTWNFVIGERNSGKSVDSWLLLWKSFHYEQRPSIVLRRLIADITPTYIDDIENLLNKFLEHPVQLVYNKGDAKSGVVDIKLGEYGVDYSWQAIKKLPTWIRMIALSNPMNRIKSLMLPNLKFIFIDEFIINIRANEKFLKDEFFMIQEIYTTFNREAKTPIRILAAANPYSVYCPLFVGLKVNTSLLKPGAFIVGDNYVIDCFRCPDALLEIIKATNPMLLDDEYARYAFAAESINDSNIPIHKTEPKGSKLKYVFRMANDYLSIHIVPNDKEMRYWICKHTKEWATTLSKRKHVYVFNFGDMSAGAQIVDIDLRRSMVTFKDAMNKRLCKFNCIDASYMAEEVYGCI